MSPSASIGTRHVLVVASGGKDDIPVQKKVIASFDYDKQKIRTFHSDPHRPQISEFE